MNGRILEEGARAWTHQNIENLKASIGPGGATKKEELLSTTCKLTKRKFEVWVAKRKDFIKNKLKFWH